MFQNQSGHSPQISDVLNVMVVREYLGTLQKDTVIELTNAFSGLQTIFSSSAFINVWSCCHVIKYYKSVLPCWCLISLNRVASASPAVSNAGSCHVKPLSVPSWYQFDIVYLCFSTCFEVLKEEF